MCMYTWIHVCVLVCTCMCLCVQLCMYMEARGHCHVSSLVMLHLILMFLKFRLSSVCEAVPRCHSTCDGSRTTFGSRVSSSTTESQRPNSGRQAQGERLRVSLRLIDSGSACWTSGSRDPPCSQALRSQLCHPAGLSCTHRGSTLSLLV